MAASPVLIGSGARAQVYLWEPGVVLKLFSSSSSPEKIEEEARLSQQVHQLGFPSPQIYGIQSYLGRQGILQEQVLGESMAKYALSHRALAEPLIKEMAALLFRLHSLDGEGFPPFASRWEEKIQHSPLDPAKKEEMLFLLQQNCCGKSLCHGDFHPENILGKPGNWMVIDWPDCGQGNPALDACRSYLILLLADPDIARIFLDTYCSLAGWEDSRVLSLLPIAAASRLAEGFASEQPFLLSLL